MSKVNFPPETSKLSFSRKITGEKVFTFSEVQTVEKISSGERGLPADGTCNVLPEKVDWFECDKIKKQQLTANNDNVKDKNVNDSIVFFEDKLVAVKEQWHQNNYR